MRCAVLLWFLHKSIRSMTHSHHASDDRGIPSEQFNAAPHDASVECECGEQGDRKQEDCFHGFSFSFPVFGFRKRGGKGEASPLPSPLLLFTDLRVPIGAHLRSAERGCASIHFRPRHAWWHRRWKGSGAILTAVRANARRRFPLPLRSGRVASTTQTPSCRG